jgi:hypothetical protein
MRTGWATPFTPLTVTEAEYQPGGALAAMLELRLLLVHADVGRPSTCPSANRCSDSSGKLLPDALVEPHDASETPTRSDPVSVRLVPGRVSANGISVGVHAGDAPRPSSYCSAAAVGVEPLLPPTTNTRPDGSNVAVC